jgi:hypothetical protein
MALKQIDVLRLLSHVQLGALVIGGATGRGAGP